MTRIIGRTTAIGIAPEAVGARGTYVAPTNWVPVTDLDFDDKVDFTDNDSGLGRIEELNDSVITKAWAEGGYEGKIFDREFGVELQALFGQNPTSVQRASSGVYDHTFTVLQSNQHRSLSLTYKDANYNSGYALAMIDSMNIDMALGKFITRKVNFHARPGTAQTSTPAPVIGNEFIPKHITATYASNLAGLNSGTTFKLTAASIDINKNLEDAFVFGRNDPDDILNKQFNVSGSFDAYFDDTTFRTDALTTGTIAIRLDIVNSDTNIGGGNNPALRLELAKVNLKDFDRKWGNNDILSFSVKFDAFFSVADSSLITARLTNLNTSYS